MIVPSFLYEYAGMRRPATKIWRPPGPKGRISAHAVTQPLGGGAAGHDLASIAQHDEQAPVVVRTQVIDGVQVDDVRAMHLQEALRVETRRHLLQAEVQQ